MFAQEIEQKKDVLLGLPVDDLGVLDVLCHFVNLNESGRCLWQVSVISSNKILTY